MIMKRLFVILGILIITAVTISIWWNNGLLAVDSANKKQEVFVIQKGQGIREISNKLKNEGFIKDPIVFFLLVKKIGLDGKIQAGDFRLSPSMNAEEIAKSLTHGTLDIWVTIPEGKHANEIADILGKTLPNYKDFWRQALNQNEGYLFPDTYLIARDSTIEIIIKQMRNNFDVKYEEAAQNPTASLSENDAVTLASIVQREAITDSDMKYVASVLENRLNMGMALGSDVTLEYALGYQPAEKTWWKKDLTVDDLKLDTPYNTRLNSGLPPTPICNPGETALYAVIHPAKSNYLYYLSDKNGKLHFARTLEQHNENIKKYE